MVQATLTVNRQSHLKKYRESLSAALAVLRKLGKGDPVKYLRDINWQDLGKQSATEVKNIVKGLRDSLDDMSTSWHYDLLLPDAAIEGMQATVKRLDDVTPKIDQHMQQAAQEIGQRVNKALDEYQGQPPIRGVTDKPTKAKADELEPPKGNELPGAERADLSQETSTVYRVQGGNHPNKNRRSKFLIAIDKNNNPKIKKERLNISIGDDSHTEHFLKARPGGEVVSFEIPKWMDEFIELESKAQLGAKKMPNYDKNTTPLRNDPTTPGRSYELPSIWAKWLEENAIDGSGKILKSHE